MSDIVVTIVCSVQKWSEVLTFIEIGAFKVLKYSHQWISTAQVTPACLMSEIDFTQYF